MDLFDMEPETLMRKGRPRQVTEVPTDSPLAERMRPQQLADFVGQRHLLGKGSVLRSAIENDRLQSMIFYGPPGSGKTTLATIISYHSQAHFVRMNAVEATVKEVREVMERAIIESASN